MTYHAGSCKVARIKLSIPVPKYHAAVTLSNYLGLGTSQFVIDRHNGWQLDRS